MPPVTPPPTAPADQAQSAAQRRRRAALAAAAAGGAAVGAGAVPPAAAAVAAAGVPSSASVAAVTAKILAAFARFSRKHRRGVEPSLRQMLGREFPDADRVTLRGILDDERKLERLFTEKAQARLRRDIPVALRSDDPAKREDAIRALLDREKRYAIMREEMMGVRAAQAGHRAQLRAVSPEGAYWMLSPDVREHTADCLAMGGKFWPWEVLDKIHPPLHGGCPCRLVGLEDAANMGLIDPRQLPDTQDAIRRAARIQEDVPEMRDRLAEAGVAMPSIGRMWNEDLHPREHGKWTESFSAKIKQLDPHESIRGAECHDVVLGSHVWAERHGGQDTVIHSHGSHSWVETTMRGERVVIDPVASSQGLGPDARPAHDTRDVTPAGHRAYGAQHETFGSREKYVAVHGRFINIDPEDAGQMADELPEHPTRVQEARVHAPELPTLPWDEAKHPRERSGRWRGVYHDAILRGLRRQGHLPAVVHEGKEGRWVYIRGGGWNHVPHDEHWERVVGGVRFSSPPHSPNVYRNGVLSSEPGRGGVKHEDHTRKPKAGARPARVHVPDAEGEQPVAADLRAQRLAASIHPNDSSVSLAERLGEQGFAYAGTHQQDRGDGEEHFFTLYKDYDAGDTIRVDIRKDGSIKKASATHDPFVVPKDDLSVLPTGAPREAGLISQDRLRETEVESQLRDHGYVPTTHTQIGGKSWHRWVNPDQEQAVMVAFPGDLDGPDAPLNPRAIRAVPDPADEKERASADHVLLRLKPMERIRLGEDMTALRNRLEGPQAAWYIMLGSTTREEVDQRLRSPRLGETTELPANWTGFSDFGHDGKQLRIAYRVEETPGYGPNRFIVTGVGRPQNDDGEHDPTMPHAWITGEGEYEANVARRNAKAEAEAAAEKEREQKTYRDRMAKGEAPVREGEAFNHELLVDLGFSATRSARADRGASRQVTYRHRENGAKMTVTYSAGRMFGLAPAGDISRVTWDKGRIGKERQPRIKGRPPASIKEMEEDILARSDELGARYGFGKTHATNVAWDRGRGFSGVHRWDGSIGLGSQGRSAIDDAIKARKEGRELTSREAARLYLAYEVAQHEVNHTVNRLESYQYQGAGITMEEALTEEMGHVLVTEWLSDHGWHEALQWARDHPEAPELVGTYNDYRQRLRELLDEAGVPEENRLAVIEDMKFRQTQDARFRTVARLITDAKGQSTLTGARDDREQKIRAFLYTSKPKDGKYIANFRPIVRSPDLEAIEPTKIDLPNGMRVGVGDRVVGLRLAGLDDDNNVKQEWARGTVTQVALVNRRLDDPNPIPYVEVRYDGHAGTSSSQGGDIRPPDYPTGPARLPMPGDHGPTVEEVPVEAGPPPGSREADGMASPERPLRLSEIAPGPALIRDRGQRTQVEVLGIVTDPIRKERVVRFRWPDGSTGKAPAREFFPLPEMQSPERSLSELPPEPGTTPVPEGHIRLYHYTDAPADTIRSEGLRIEHARGSQYGEPDLVWGSARPPDPDLKTFAEFHVPWDDPRVRGGVGGPITAEHAATVEQRASHIGLAGSVQPHEIVAVHEPWHNGYRYLTETPSTRAAVERGEYDWATEGGYAERYGKAIERIKAEAGMQSPGGEPQLPQHHEVTAAFLGEHGQERLRTNVDGVETGGGRVTVHGTVTTAAGRHAGGFTRHFEMRDGELYVHHGGLELEPEHQRKGFSSDFNRSAEAAYRRMGVKAITVTAGRAGGGRAWARTFDFDEARLPEFGASSRRELVAGLFDGARSAGRITGPEREALRAEEPTISTPAQIAALGDLGTRVLAGARWPGIRYLR